MNDQTMQETLAMRRWAVIGASDDRGRYGYRIYRLLKDRGYQVYPVNPNHEEIEGDRCYPDIASLPEPPEVVDFVVNPRDGARVMGDVAAAGIRYAWMQPGTRSDEIRGLARDGGVELIEDCVLIQIERFEPPPWQRGG